LDLLPFKSFLEKLLEQLTIDKLIALGTTVYLTVKEFLILIFQGVYAKRACPYIGEKP